jgi:hypothetical protein
MKQLDNINLADAKTLLRDMRTYADMTKKLWNRWQALFMKGLLWEKTLKIEYFPALWVDGAWLQAEGVFFKSFWVTAKKDGVEFVPSPILKWGMKVYCDDDMVDLSFKKVEYLMQK